MIMLINGSFLYRLVHVMLAPFKGRRGRIFEKFGGEVRLGTDVSHDISYATIKLGSKSLMWVHFNNVRDPTEKGG